MQTLATLLLLGMAVFAQVNRPVGPFQTDGGVVRIPPIQPESPFSLRSSSPGSP